MIWVSSFWSAGSVSLHIGNFVLSALMKLTRPANLSPHSRVQTIFLPSSAHVQVNPNNPPTTTSDKLDDDSFDRNENYLRKLDRNVNDLVKLIAQANQNEIKRRQAGNQTMVRSTDDTGSASKRNKKRRRNNKFLYRRPTTANDEYLMNRDNHVNYVDCVAVGWGKYRNSGDLSDVLLKIEVPIQDIKRYKRWKRQIDPKTASSGNSSNFPFIKTQFAAHTIHLFSPVSGAKRFTPSLCRSTRVSTCAPVTWMGEVERASATPAAVCSVKSTEMVPGFS